MKVWATTERNLPDRSFTIVVFIFGTVAWQVRNNAI